jgi:Domain of unknown function (DUF1883)
MAYRYTYHDLGQLDEGSTVLVRLRGNAANVMLVDALNFALYRAGEHFLFTGGFTRRSPVRLQVPEEGHWYLVLDLGGYRGRVWAQEMTVLRPEGAESDREPRHVLANSR